MAKYNVSLFRSLNIDPKSLINLSGDELHIPKVSNIILIPKMIPIMIKLVIKKLNRYILFNDVSLKAKFVIRNNINNKITNENNDSTIAYP